jgi:transcriptional regulator with XRE-family HTH domain
MDRPIDVTALYVSLDSTRQGKALSWRELAAKLGISSSIFTRLAQGSAPGFESYKKMTAWLGASTEDYLQGERPSQEEAEDTMEKIGAYLHADQALKPESARALETIMRAAYEEMAEER